MIIFHYILLFTVTIATIISLALEDTYTSYGIISIVFASSCILDSKSEKRSLAINLAFWLSSVVMGASLVLKQFLT